MERHGSEFGGSQVISPPGTDGASTSRAIVAAPPMPPAIPSFGGFAPRGPEILVGGFNQTWLVNCLRRRWLMATLMGLLIGAGVAGFLMWLFPESSRITSYLEVKSSTAMSPFDDGRRIVNINEIQREAAMHPALIKSPLVLEAALIKNDIAELDAVQYHKGEEVLWLVEELKVSFSAESPILEVRYEGEEGAEDMVKIVNAVVQSYKDNVLMQDRVQQSATQDDLNSVLQTLEGELKKKMEDLKAMAGVNGSSLEFKEVELPQLRNDISMYQAQLITIEKELADIEVLKEVAVQQARSPATLDAAVAQALEKDPTIKLYQEQLFVLTQQIQQFQSTGKNAGNSQLKRLQALYGQTDAAMRQYQLTAEKDLRERFEKLPNEALRAAIVEYQVRAQFLTQKKTELEQQLQTAKTRIEEVAVGDPETQMLEADVEAQQELMFNLKQKVMEAQVQQRQYVRASSQRGKDTDYEKVHVIQPALATEKINYYERLSIAGIGGAAALALTCYGVALLEFRRRRLNSPTDLDEGMGIRVLGVLPPASLKAIGGHSLVATQVSESIDNVRATIMHDSTSRPRQIVMVVSPDSMEGATMVASSLAISLARAGRRTLLVDGDLRSPDLHKLFGMPVEDGFSEVLRAEIDLVDAIRPTNYEGLHLLTAGVCDMDAVHALATDQPQAIFDKLRDQFDFVVIDSPPVLGISDALSLGQYVDGAVLTVLRDHSEIRKIHHALEVLRSMGVRVIGSVVNGVPTKADRRVVRLHQAGSQRTPRLPAKAPTAE